MRIVKLPSGVHFYESQYRRPNRVHGPAEITNSGSQTWTFWVGDKYDYKTIYSEGIVDPGMNKLLIFGDFLYE